MRAKNNLALVELKLKLENLEGFLCKLPSSVSDNISPLVSDVAQLISDVAESLGNQTDTPLQSNPDCPECGGKMARAPEHGPKFSTLSKKQADVFPAKAAKKTVYVCNHTNNDGEYVCGHRMTTIEIPVLNVPYSVERSKGTGKGGPNGIVPFDLYKLAASIRSADDQIGYVESMRLATLVHAEIYWRKSARKQDPRTCSSKTIGNTVLDILYHTGRMVTWQRYALFFKRCDRSSNFETNMMILKEAAEKCQQSPFLVKYKEPRKNGNEKNAMAQVLNRRFGQ